MPKSNRKGDAVIQVEASLLQGIKESFRLNDSQVIKLIQKNGCHVRAIAENLVREMMHHAYGTH